MKPIPASHVVDVVISEVNFLMMHSSVHRVSGDGDVIGMVHGIYYYGGLPINTPNTTYKELDTHYGLIALRLGSLTSFVES